MSVGGEAKADHGLGEGGVHCEEVVVRRGVVGESGELELDGFGEGEILPLQVDGIPVHRRRRIEGGGGWNEHWRVLCGYKGR